MTWPSRSRSASADIRERLREALMSPCGPTGRARGADRHARFPARRKYSYLRARPGRFESRQEFWTCCGTSPRCAAPATAYAGGPDAMPARKVPRGASASPEPAAQRDGSDAIVFGVEIGQEKISRRAVRVVSPRAGSGAAGVRKATALPLTAKLPESVAAISPREPRRDMVELLRTSACRGAHRFGRSSPRCCSAPRLYYGGKEFDSKQGAEALARLPSVQDGRSCRTTARCRFLCRIHWFLPGEGNRIRESRVTHPLSRLFVGHHGVPKCIVHAPAELAAAPEGHRLHAKDRRPHVLIHHAGRMCGTVWSRASPPATMCWTTARRRAPALLFDFADARHDHFGTSAKFIDASPRPAQSEANAPHGARERCSPPPRRWRRGIRLQYEAEDDVAVVHPGGPTSSRASCGQPRPRWRGEIQRRGWGWPSSLQRRSFQ